jgi:hypothetical protein
MLELNLKMNKAVRHSLFDNPPPNFKKNNVLFDDEEEPKSKQNNLWNFLSTSVIGKKPVDFIEIKKTKESIKGINPLVNQAFAKGRRPS